MGLRLLEEITQAINESPDLPSALQVVLRKVCETTGCSYGEVWIPRHDNAVLECRADCCSDSSGCCGKPESLEKFQQVTRQLTLQPGVGLPGRVWATQQAEWVQDISTASGKLYLRSQVARESDLRAAFGVPLVAGGEVLAVFVFFMSTAKKKDKNAVAVVSAVANHLGSFLQRKRAEEALCRAYDELEGEVRKRTEKLEEANDALRQEHNFISAILSTVGALVVVLDLHGRVVYFNRACEQTTGYTFEEVVGWYLWDFLLTPEETKGVQKVFQGLQLQGLPSQHENFWVCKNGERRRIAWSNNVVRDGKGSILYVIGTGIDITERKRVEEALHRSESRTRALLNAIPDLMFRYHLDGTFLDFHAQDPSELAKPPEVIIGSKVYQLPLPRDVIDQIMTASKQAIASEQVQTVDYSIQMPSGRQTYEARITASGTEELVAIVRNITERKRAEEELRKAEQRFTLFMENLPGAAFMKDTGRRHIYVNQAVEKLFGLSQSEILGKSNEEVWPADVALRIETDDRTVLENGEVLQLIEPIPQQDGLHYYHTTKFPILDPQGIPYLLGGIGIDVTKQRRTEDALRASEGNLRESQEELRALTARLISAREEETKHLARELHDVFSQRLAVLGMETAGVEQRFSCSDPACCKILHDVGEEIGSLAKDVHQLSRELHPSILDDLGLTAALRAECAAFSRQHNIPVQFEPVNVPESLPAPVSLGLYRIAQESLRNIGKHAGATAVRVTLDGADGAILLAIEDNGSGFDFGRIKGRRGLGLVSMEERVRLVEGSIAIRSQAGAGTRVAVRVPLGRSNP